MLHSLAVFFEVVRYSRHLVRSEVSETLEIVLVSLNSCQEVVRVRYIAHFVHFLNLLLVEGDQYTWNDWGFDPSFLAQLGKFKEFIRIPEVLSDDEVSTFIDLGLELVNALV